MILGLPACLRDRAKSLDAAYEAGSRGAAWLKVKPAHTLDLVVLAVERGSGRRERWLSNLHLGARDAESGQFVMLGKTFMPEMDEGDIIMQTAKLPSDLFLWAAGGFSSPEGYRTAPSAGALYPLELETGAVLTVMAYNRQTWDTPLYQIMPFSRNVRQDGIVL